MYTNTIVNIFVAIFTVIYYKTVECKYRCTSITSIVAVIASIYAYVKTVNLPIVQNIFVTLGTWHLLHLIDLFCRA